MPIVRMGFVALSFGFLIDTAVGCRPASDSNERGAALTFTPPEPAGGAWLGVTPRPDRLAHHPEREYDERGHVGELAWSDAQWRAHCHGLRTSYNPDSDLHDDALTLTPDDPRWPDFVFWSLQNKVNEHQVEAYAFRPCSRRW